MQKSLLRQLYEALKPLLDEGVNQENWNRIAWENPQWVFQIVHDNLRYTYTVGSLHRGEGKSPEFEPLYPDPIGEPTSESPAASGYMVTAELLPPTRVDILHGDGYCEIYYPTAGQTVEEWAKNFMSRARAKAANLNIE